MHSDFVHLGCFKDFQGLCGVYLALGFCGIALCAFSLWVVFAHARSTMFHSSFRKCLLHYCSFLSLFHAARNLFIGGWQVALVYEWLISTLHALIAYYMFILYQRMSYATISIRWVRLTLVGIVSVRLIFLITMLSVMKPDTHLFCQNPYWLTSAIVQFLITMCYCVAILFVVRIFEQVSIMKSHKSFQKALLHTLWSGMLYGSFTSLVFNFLNFYQRDHKCDNYTNIESTNLLLRFIFRVSYCVVPVFVTIFVFYKWDTPFRSVDSADLLESSEPETFNDMFWTPTHSVYAEYSNVQSLAEYSVQSRAEYSVQSINPS